MRSIVLLPLLILSQTVLAHEFCVRAQQVIAATSVTPHLQVPTNRDDFVASKAFDEPFTVQQFESNPLPSDAGVHRVLSCKMRTAERINAAFASEGDAPVAQQERDCAAVHRVMLDDVLARVPEQGRALDPRQIVIDEEEMTFMGPSWLEPWPFQPVSLDAEGKLHLHSRSLYAPHAWWMPLPERFLGNYYCHLVAPAYLEGLIRGSYSLPGD